MNKPDQLPPEQTGQPNQPVPFTGQNQITNSDRGGTDASQHLEQRQKPHLLQKRAEAPSPEELPYLDVVEAALHRRGKISTRWLLLGACSTFFVLLLWAALADIDEMVRSVGQVTPAQRVQHIQNLEGGILREVLVREGQHVEKDDLLLRIDNEQAGSVYRDAVTKSLDLKAAIARVEAELAGADPNYPPEVLEQAPDSVKRQNDLLASHRRQDEAEIRALQAKRELYLQEIEEQLSKQRTATASLALAVKQRDLARPLMSSRSMSSLDFMNLEQRVLTLQGELNVLESTIPKSRAAVREVEERLTLRKAELDAEDLAEINRYQIELNSMRELMVSGGDRVTRTEVRSPVRGTVKRINISTVGGVIMPGEVIMEVVPSDSSLIVEARVSPQDIAFIYEGQPARVKLSAYDSAIYGAMDAIVEQISADSIEGKAGEYYYLVKLRTGSNTLLHNGKELPIIPGMLATIDFITGKKTVLDYLLKPILRAQQNAMRER